MKYFLLLFLAVMPLQAIKLPVFLRSLIVVAGRVTPSNLSPHHPIPQPQQNADGTFSKDPVQIFVRQGRPLQQEYYFGRARVATRTPDNHIQVYLPTICVGATAAVGLAVVLSGDSAIQRKS